MVDLEDRIRPTLFAAEMEVEDFGSRHRETRQTGRAWPASGVRENKAAGAL